MQSTTSTLELELERAATSRYRLDLARALHPIAPTLSALHASRAAALDPDTSAVLHATHCPKCGTYRFSGDHSTHLDGLSGKTRRRQATSSRPKIFLRRCRLCGFSTDAFPTTLDDSSAPTPLPIDSTSKSEAVQNILQTKRIGLPPADSPRTIPAQSLPGRLPKSSHAKTSTLRDMLSRDRQREKVVKARKERKDHERLAAFLKEL